jgi:hypothetical protein
VELATALVTHFHPFSNSISLDGNGLDDALDASLAAFTADIEAAVPSYLGRDSIEITTPACRGPT